MDVAFLLSNPWVTHVLAVVAGWVGLAQPAVIANLWAKILGVATTVSKAQDIIKLIDAMLKTHGLIPADAPVVPTNTVVAVANGTSTVTEAKVALKAMKKG